MDYIFIHGFISIYIGLCSCLFLMTKFNSSFVTTFYIKMFMCAMMLESVCFLPIDNQWIQEINPYCKMTIYFFLEWYSSCISFEPIRAPNDVKHHNRKSVNLIASCSWFIQISWPGNLHTHVYLQLKIEPVKKWAFIESPRVSLFF